jgi:excisionase family DNA binding protein
MSSSQTYTINEAAALTGLHGNTIRKRIKQGQLEARVRPGKFGEEYRISYEALKAAGMLPEEGPLGSANGTDPVVHAELVTEGGSEPDLNGAGGESAGDRVLESQGTVPEHLALVQNTVSALGELYQRHEQAMFRLGYLQSEVERLNTAAGSAEERQQAQAERDRELEELRKVVTLQQQQLRDEAFRQQQKTMEADLLRRELEQARERLKEMEALRKDQENLKNTVAHQQQQLRTFEESRKKRGWKFWDK